MKNWLMRWPLRWLLPVLLVALALPSALWLYLLQREEYARAVAADESARLIERLALEQTRLEVQLGFGNRLQVRRIVTSLGLSPHLRHAWLIGADGRIVAALSRLELDQPWESARAKLPPALAAALPLQPDEKTLPAPTLSRPASTDFLVGEIAVRPGHRLIVVSDLAVPLAQRLASGRSELALQVATPLVLALFIGVFFRWSWLKRLRLLTNTAARLGAGELTARAALAGGDELAEIGAAFDTMAAQIERQQIEIRRLAELVEQSPLVAIVWRNEPGWPVDFVSDNIVRWGLDKQALLSGKLRYVDLIHPDDLTAIEDDVAQHLARGPDRYVQEYRLRDGFGHWRWIEDHTWLERDESGQVRSIRGVLLDVSSRFEAEAQLREKSAELSARNAELERFAEAAIGRELEMLRLKQEINALSVALGKPPPFTLPHLDDTATRP